MAITRAQIAKQLLAQGGRTGFRIGSDEGDVSGREYGGSSKGLTSREERRSGQYTSPEAKAVVASGGGDNKVDVGFQEALKKQEIAKKKKQARDEGFKITGGVKYSPPSTFQKFKNKVYQSSINRNKYLALQNLGLIPTTGFTGLTGAVIEGFLGKIPENLQDLTEEELNSLALEVNKLKAGGQNVMTNKMMSGKNLLDRTFEAQDLLDSGKMTQTDYDTLFPGPTIAGDRDGPDDPCRGPNPPAYCFTGIRSAAPVVEEEPEYVNPLSLLTPRIAGTQFAADGGRIGLFKGAQADASAGKGAMSPGTDTGGGFRGGNGDGPKGPPRVINPPPKIKPDKPKFSYSGSFQPTFNFIKKFMDHDKFTDQMKMTATPNYHQMGGLDFMARFPNMNPDTAKMLASAYQNIFELGRAVADGPGGKTIGDALDTAKEEAALNAIGIDAFSDPTSEIYKQYTDSSSLLPAVKMAGGGIASLDDMDREGFLLGGIAKGLKKAVRGVKKLAKSPIGKVALGAALFKFGPSIFGKGSFNPLKQLVSSEGFSGLGPSKFAQFLGKYGLADVSKMALTPKGAMAGIGLTSALAGLTTPKEDEDKFDLAKYYGDSQLEPSQSIRGMGSEFDFYGGERMRVAEGGSTEKEPVAKKTMPLLDMDGMEKDYREEGGFVPIGRMEKADDVPARLSKNEFVFTADAVRNAGDGDVDKGAEVMYNMMKNLESGGDVSEESQGLEGAREMFQTSQRLGEVI